MQIVIDIDENLYIRLVDTGVKYIEDLYEACVAIRKGTLLQKEEPDCEYYRDLYGGICLAQKCAPRCECCGAKERCDI